MPPELRNVTDPTGGLGTWILDAAIDAGVIVVAAAGNEGTAGMSYPGAYAPVISAAAIGWDEQWTTRTWWYALDAPDPTDAGTSTSPPREITRHQPDTGTSTGIPGVSHRRRCSRPAARNARSISGRDSEKCSHPSK